MEWSPSESKPSLGQKRQINISLDRDTASRFYDYKEI